MFYSVNLPSTVTVLQKYEIHRHTTQQELWYVVQDGGSFGILFFFAYIIVLFTFNQITLSLDLI